MKGFCGMFGNTPNPSIKLDFLKSINLANTLETKSVSGENFFLGSSHLKATPLKGNHIYQTEEYVFVFAGDLVDYKELPWKLIKNNFTRSNFKWFSRLRGVFALAIYNKRSNHIHLISDHRSQLPVYYGYIENAFVFSTDIATFTLLDTVPEFNVQWLYEYLYFNFPIGKTTCLKSIDRLLPMTVLHVDLNQNTSDQFRYGKYFSSPKKLSSGKEALDKCVNTLKERVPKYFENETINHTSLTSGFDTRTLLSLSPKDSPVKTYTYGTANSEDQKITAELAKDLELNHRQILFDENFTKALPNLIYDTVRLSGGTQSILRSTLPFVYKSFYHRYDKNAAVVIGGIIGECLFRGGGANPAITSQELDDYFYTGKISINTTLYEQMFDSAQFQKFKQHIHDKFHTIQSLYGDPLKDVHPRLSYDCYEVVPKYFGGEFAIASNYVTLRQPFWDRDVLETAFETEFSAVSKSPLVKNKKGNFYRTYMVQTTLLNENSKFKKLIIHGMPTFLFAKGNRLLFRICWPFIRAYAYLTRNKPSKAPLENWEYWFKEVLSDEFDKLINKDSKLSEFMSTDCMLAAKKSNNTQLLNKFVTAEILLSLIGNRWGIESKTQKKDHEITPEPNNSSAAYQATN